MSLRGKKIKDVWRSFITLQLSTSPTPMTTGDGQQLPIRMSATEVEIDGLKINPPSGGSSSEALVVDSSGRISKRQLPFFRPTSAKVNNETNPSVSIDNGLGSASSVSFVGTDGLQVQGSGSSLIFSLIPAPFNNITSSVVLNQEDYKKTHLIDAASLAGGDIRLPAPTAGMSLKFVIDVASSTEFNFVTNDEGGSSQAQYFYGKAFVHKDAGSSSATQVITRATASAAPASYDHVKIDSNSATSGGREGDVIEFFAYDSSGWLVSANLTTNQNVGTLAVITAS